MCQSCGGTCSPPPPRFTAPAGPVPMSLVGSVAGPDQAPTGVVRTYGQMLTYESMWAGLGPNGEPAAFVIPGTYGGYATRAGRR